MGNNMSMQMATLEKIEKSLRKKVNEQIPVFKSLPVAQTLTTTQGDKALKANPAIAEIRALFRDYTSIVKTMYELNGKTEDEEPSALADLRSRYKVVAGGR